MLRKTSVCAVFVFVFLAMPGGVQGAVIEPQESRTVADGVYSEAQADSGKEAVETNCASCHRNDLSGDDGPPLKGERFLGHYLDGNLDALFTRIKTTMPRGDAGSLPDQTYIEIVAYILRINEFPSGRRGLTVDLASEIKVVGKADAGPPPDFALVQMVGCLMQGPNNTWLLQNTSAPARTRTPTEPTPAEITAAKGQSLGAGTFTLLYYDTFKNGFNPAEYKGQKMEGRGFLITKPDNRLSVTWLEAVDSACAP
jgi:cytochrome c553